MSLQIVSQIEAFKRARLEPNKYPYYPQLVRVDVQGTNGNVAIWISGMTCCLKTFFDADTVFAKQSAINLLDQLF